jgi:hypothetical protein
MRPEFDILIASNSRQQSFYFIDFNIHFTITTSNRLPTQFSIKGM